MSIANKSAVVFTVALCFGFPGAMVGTALPSADSISILTGPAGSGTATVPSTIGLQFSTTKDFTVTHLSFYDEGSDGLNESHTIGLWDQQQNLIVSAVIPSGTQASLSADGAWRLADVQDFVLPAGTNYMVGATFSAVNGDPLYTSIGPAIPGVTDGGGYVSLGAGLLFPDPSMRIRRGWGVAGIFVVPEPSVAVLLGFGVVPVFLSRRRGRRTSRGR